MFFFSLLVLTQFIEYNFSTNTHQARLALTLHTEGNTTRAAYSYIRIVQLKMNYTRVEIVKKSNEM